jgi:hypothetical protein
MNTLSLFGKTTLSTSILNSLGPTLHKLLASSHRFESSTDIIYALKMRLCETLPSFRQYGTHFFHRHNLIRFDPGVQHVDHNHRSRAPIPVYTNQTDNNQPSFLRRRGWNLGASKYMLYGQRLINNWGKMSTPVKNYQFGVRALGCLYAEAPILITSTRISCGTRGLEWTFTL